MHIAIQLPPAGFEIKHRSGPLRCILWLSTNACMHISSCYLTARGQLCTVASNHLFLDFCKPSSCSYQKWFLVADLPSCVVQPVHRWQCCLQLHLHGHLLRGLLPQLSCRHHRKRYPNYRFARNCQKLPQVSHQCFACLPRQVMYVGACQLPRHDYIVLFALCLAASQFWIAIRCTAQLCT